MSDDAPEKELPEQEAAEAAEAEASASEASASEASSAEAGDAAAEGEVKPKRASRRKKADAEAGEAEQAAAETEQPDAEKTEKPKRARRPRRAASGGDEAAAEAAQAEQPKAKARRSKPAASSSSAPRASAAARGQGASRPVVRAQAKYVRTSARKARMVCGHIRGKSVAEARAILAFTPRQVARDWAKVLDSAVANAENNHELVEEDLVVREAYADEGPTIKRFRPRARGRASSIRKRTSHLTITLTPGD